MVNLFKKTQPCVTFKEYKVRLHGSPKLTKPKELRGIKQFTSIDFISNKCKCALFKKGNDIWVKHRDYFSQILPPEREELGMPLNYFAEKHLGKNRAAKFVYEDAWGSVVARNEAWLVFKNLAQDISNNIFVIDIRDSILRQIEYINDFEAYSLSTGYMSRFIEQVIKETQEYITNKEVIK